MNDVNNNLKLILKFTKFQVLLFAGHEYTEANARFAETIETGNRALQERIKHVRQLRDKRQWTITTTMGLEKATNPFLRPEMCAQ
jgi:hydroxyacylglutathione hydrolase